MRIGVSDVHEADKCTCSLIKNEILPDVHFIQEQDDTFLIVLTGKDFTCVHELFINIDAEACCSWNVVSIVAQCTLRRERNASC